MSTSSARHPSTRRVVVSFRVVVFAVCLTFCGPSLIAQPANEFGVWIGGSAGAPTLIGKTEHVSLFIAAIRYSRLFVQHPAFNLRYTIDLVPVMRFRYGNVETVNGRGAAPVGFEMSFRPGRRLEPAVGLRGGFIYFDQEVPYTMGRRLNFSADLGVGLRIHIRQSVAMHAGYKYYHLSNGYRAPANPGFDSNLFVIGANISR